MHRLYLDTSIVIRALKPGKKGSRIARRFIEKCCSKHACIYTTVHLVELPRGSSALEFLEEKAVYREIDLKWVRRAASMIIDAKGLSPSRELDLMHLIAAKTLECQGILARDRFLRRYAKKMGLTYVNWETHSGECP